MNIASNPMPAILVVDDSEDDVLVLRRTLKRLDVINPLRHFARVDEALEYFSLSNPKPDNIGLILLDVNLPGLDGVDFLNAFRADVRQQCIPVVMFTTSDAPTDVAKCYRAGANAFVTKPVAISAFSEALSNILAFWLKTARQPTSCVGEI